MEIGKKKNSTKIEMNEKVGMVKQMLGAKFSEMKEGFQLQNKETVKELREQSESLIRQEELLNEQKQKIEKLEELISSMKRLDKEVESQSYLELIEAQNQKLELQEEMLTEQGKKLVKLEELLGNFDMQASMFELQGSKMESILSNFPKLEGNIVGKLSENLESKIREFSDKLEKLQKQSIKTNFYMNILSFFIILVQISSITYLLYFFMNR